MADSWPAGHELDAHVVVAALRAPRPERVVAAQERGDLRTATARLGRAVELAQAIKEATGNDATARLLAEVVDVDPATGTARLRAEASKAARMTLDSRSTVTVRVRG